MTKVWIAAAAVAVLGTFYACGTDNKAPVAQSGETGEVRINLNGGIQVGAGDMAEIEIRNVFDPSQVFLVDCNQKNHLLDGGTFCDELVVLPPGVYEVLVQSTDPTCRPERDWYKVVVQPNQTVELTVNLICGQANGALDVIVTEEHTPIISNIDFTFALADGGTTPGNKFYCLGSGPMTVSLTVTDPDDPTCAGLTGRFTATFTPDNPNAQPFTFNFPATQNGCDFSFIFNIPAGLTGTWNITLDVTEGTFPSDGGAPSGGLSGSFSFPLHVISCPADGGA